MAHIINKKEIASTMMKMAPGMKGMSPGMMKMTPEMMHGMKDMGSEMMKSMMNSGMGNRAAHETAKVIIVTGGSGIRQGIIGNLARNPFVLIGLGVAAGYLIFKYRQEIVSKTEVESTN